MRDRIDFCFFNTKILFFKLPNNMPNRPNTFLVFVFKEKMKIFTVYFFPYSEFLSNKLKNSLTHQLKNSKTTKPIPVGIRSAWCRNGTICRPIRNRVFRKLRRFREGFCFRISVCRSRCIWDSTTASSWSSWC